MTLVFNAEIQFLIEQLREHQQEDEQTYLVGGIVRDLILNHPVHDVDIAFSGNVKKYAKRFADSIRAKYFILNDRFKTARVIWKNSSGQRIYIDIVGLRGESIIEDCQSRDFTINAMALDVHDTQKLIDPTNGLKDLQNGVIRACRKTTFQQDPIRIMRAVRQSINFNFRIEKQTIQHIRVSASRLSDVTAERLRDEIFRLFALQDPLRGIRLLEYLGIFAYIFPELDAFRKYVVTGETDPNPWLHTQSVLMSMTKLFSVVVGDYSDDRAGDLFSGEASLLLGRYRTKLKQYFSTPVSADRNRKSLLFFSALYHDSGKPFVEGFKPDGSLSFFDHDRAGGEIIEEKSGKLALSNNETVWLSKVVRNHMQLHFSAKKDNKLSKLTLYRFFNTLGDASIAVCLLTLSDTLAYQMNNFPQQRWQNELHICRQIMDEYWADESRLLNPPRFLNGSEIKEILDVNDGPKIGYIISQLREASAVGIVNNRDEAVNYIKKIAP